MRNRYDHHFDMLQFQIGSIFKYYNENVTNKWVMESFEPLVIEGGTIVSYEIVQDPEAPARRRLFIRITVEGRLFKFFQDYSYGVPLSGGVHYQQINKDKDLADMEYALSIATEHTALQISKFGE